MFRLSHELKQSVHETMGWPGPMTYRQYLAWQAWLEMEWDRPNRADWYAMQVAAEIRRGTYMHAGITTERVQEINMKLVFRPATDIQKDEMTDEQYYEWEMNLSKQAALARRTGIVQEVPREELSEMVNGEQQSYIEEQPDWTIQ